MMPRVFRFSVFVALLFSAGCASITSLLAPRTPTPAPTKQIIPTPQPIATETAPTVTGPRVLHIWVPPEFNPDADTPSADLLKQRLQKFEAQHPDVKIEIRIKKAEGENAILDSLSVTSIAAPAALPDLVALSRSDLESAALKGLLHPIDGLSTALHDPDWYGYARQLGQIQNTGYGLPFAGNVLVLVYYPELGKIVDWQDILASEGQLVFPAGNSQGLVGLSLYASAGGEILNAQGLPTLDKDVLTRVLSLVENGVSKEVFPRSLANVSTEAQTLQIYRTGSANKGIIWILNYRSPSDGAITPLPGLEEAPFAFASGWVWALAGSNPESQQVAAKLAEYLVGDDFIGEWTRETGYLPTRPSSLDENDRTMAAILESAHVIPSNDVLTVLGPLMQEALTRVLSGEKAEDVAASVVEKLQ
jgi:multiple sugar transport system substrate-binding protein